MSLSQTITAIEEPEMDAAYVVTITDDETGEVVETFTTGEMGDFLPPEESFEERYAPFGPAWQAEREQAAGYR
jgi:hypothetical protein